MSRTSRILVIVACCGMMWACGSPRVGNGGQGASSIDLEPQEVECSEDEYVQETIQDLYEEPGLPRTALNAIETFFSETGGKEVPTDEFETLSRSDSVRMVLEVDGRRVASIRVEEVGEGWAVEEATFCSSLI